ncbi:MAG: dihydroorotate dehydrogenase electron transfer subunit [Pseudomonadota bacterium]
MVIEQQTEVVFNRPMASNTFMMGIRSSKMGMHAKPGQFVMIQVRQGIDPLLRRPFSICGILDHDILLILYRVVGRGTAIMAEIREGERVSVMGPLGHGFDIWGSHSLSLLVAGGIGVAPLFFLAQRLEAGNIPFRLMMGFGSSDEVISAEHVPFDDRAIFIATDDGTAGYAGSVTDLLEDYLKNEKRERNSLSVFSCGPISMLKKVAAMVINHRISCQASFETTMACGLGACQGCAIRTAAGVDKAYSHVCKDGPVFDIRDIDWERF